MSLLEKGWAKLVGSYAGSESVSLLLANIHLSGVPSESNYHDQIRDRTEFWDSLLIAEKRRFKVTTRSAPKTGACKVAFHVQAKEIESGGETIRVIGLENTWGEFDKRDYWSAGTNQKLTSDLRQQHGLIDGDKKFFIIFDDFVRAFHETMLSSE